MDPQATRTIDLSRLTTFRIGGRPRFYARPADQDELRGALAECRRLALPVRVMGGGSNLLVDDGALPFGVVHMRRPGFGIAASVAPQRIAVCAGM